MDYSQNIEKFLTGLATWIRKEQEKKGITASGESGKSLRVDVRENRGEILGRGYIEFQEYGRGPTTKAGNGSLRSIIRRWLDQKAWSRGLDPKKKDSLAFLITRKIHKFGTERGRNPKYPGLGLSAEIVKKQKEFVAEIRGENARYWSQVIRTLKVAK